MFDQIAGGSGKFAEQPFCKAHISPIISPMRYGEDAFDVALAGIKRGMPLNCITAAMSGATSPATIDGILTASSLVSDISSVNPRQWKRWSVTITIRNYLIDLSQRLGLKDGAKDMWQRANTKVKQVMANHHPNYIARHVDQKIRQTHNIKLF